MSDYIKREDAVIEVERFGGYLDDDMLYRIKLALGRLPSADVVEVKHGHWDFYGLIDDIYGHGASCSGCGGYSEDNGYYCSCCGAKMDDALQRKKNPEAF